MRVRNELVPLCLLSAVFGVQPNFGFAGSPAGSSVPKQEGTKSQADIKPQGGLDQAWVKKIEADRGKLHWPGGHIYEKFIDRFPNERINEFWSFFYKMGVGNVGFGLESAGFASQDKVHGVIAKLSCAALENRRSKILWSVNLYNGTRANLKKEAKLKGTLYKYLAACGYVLHGKVPEQLRAVLDEKCDYAYYYSDYSPWNRSWYLYSDESFPEEPAEGLGIDFPFREPVPMTQWELDDIVKHSKREVKK